MKTSLFIVFVIGLLTIRSSSVDAQILTGFSIYDEFLYNGKVKTNANGETRFVAHGIFGINSEDSSIAYLVSVDSQNIETIISDVSGVIRGPVGHVYIEGIIPEGFQIGNVCLKYKQNNLNVISWARSNVKYQMTNTYPIETTRIDPFAQYKPYNSKYKVTTIPYFNHSVFTNSWVPSLTPMLTSGQDVYTSNGQYLMSLQTDGNFVIYRASNWEVLWTANTNGKGGKYLFFQGDGNLVLYKNNDMTGAVWSSGIVLDYPHPFTNYTKFIFQDDGNFVMYYDGLSYIDILGETQTNNRKSSHFGKL